MRILLVARGTRVSVYVWSYGSIQSFILIVIRQSSSQNSDLFAVT